MTIEETARKFLGVRWKHQGRNPAIGLDCAGLGKVVLVEHGYVIHDRTDYGPDPDGSLVAEITRALGPQVQMPVQPNDFVMMEFVKGKPRHVGIVGSHPHGLTLIHSCSRQGRVAEIVMDQRWLSCIVGVWRPV